MTRIFALLIFSIFVFPGVISAEEVREGIDSIFAFSDSQNHDGLKFAIKNNQGKWEYLGKGKGFTFLGSDFGPWGSHKKMIEPRLNRTSEGWKAEWYVSGLKQTIASSESIDLIHWKPQTYRRAEGNKERCKIADFQVRQIVVGNDTLTGVMAVADKSDILKLRNHVADKELQQALCAERMKDDAVRFKGLKPINLKLTPQISNAYKISDKLIGIFFEDINRAADGGLYAEMIQNRDFEYLPSDKNNKDWNSSYAWKLTDDVGKQLEMKFSESNPIHPNNSVYLHLSKSSEGRILENKGFDGISLNKGEQYYFSLFARNLSVAQKNSTLKIYIEGPDGQTCADASVKIKGDRWKKYEVTVNCRKNVRQGKLKISIPASGAMDLDMISLFPKNTFKGRRNGLRKDLAESLAALNPKFIRFPGGCVAHGDGIDNIYDWKGSIGSLESRKPLRNIWNYHQSRGLGYHEYFLMCEDMGATPLPVVAAGVPCQNSGRAYSGSTDEITTLGQQCGIPMDKMDEYTQDILDLIEYANGDISTEWGGKRAAAGHPKPFDLKYIGIGNEDMITPVFEERFKYIQKRVNEKYPEICIVGTVGPFYEGSDYDEGWSFARQQRVEMVDEHYYVEPGWFLHHRDFYDNYDRKGPHVYLGEYASHIEGRKNNMETALTVGLYLTDVERNGDVVEMTSYAPLLAKSNHINWRPDLIYFDNDSVKLTPDYYVQWLYGNNAGTQYIPIDIRTGETLDDDVKKRIGCSITRDENSGDLIMKIANLLPVELNIEQTLGDVEDYDDMAEITLLCGSPDEECTKPVSESVYIKDGILRYGSKPYSISVVRLKNIKR